MAEHLKNLQFDYCGGRQNCPKNKELFWSSLSDTGRFTGRRIRSSSSADLRQQVIKFSYSQRFRNKALEAWLFIQVLDFKIFVR